MNQIEYVNQVFSKPYYSLRTDLTQKVLDIQQAGQHAGLATIYKGWGGDNQQFAIKKVQNSNNYIFQCKKGGYLTVSDASDKPRICLQGLQNNKPKKTQLFKIGKKTKDGHVIQTHCGKVLDVFQQNKKEGTPVYQYKYQGEKKKNQHWHFCDPKDITSSSSHND